MINKFLEIDNSNFVFTLNRLLDIDSRSLYFEKILSFYSFDREIFISELKNKNSNYNFIPNKNVKKFPSELNSKFHLMPYHAVFYLMNKYSSQDLFLDARLIDLIFQFHFSILYTLNNSSEKDLLSKLEQPSLFFVRVLEILIGLCHHKLVDVYFPKNKHLILHFIEKISFDELESNKISVQEASKNHLLYEENGAAIAIYTSRKLLSNFKIISLVDAVHSYNNLITLDFDLSRKKKKSIRTPNHKVNNETGYRSLENIPSSALISEAIEESAHEIVTARIGDNNKDNQAPNRYKQVHINRSYSANYTRSNMLSTTRYEIPVKEHLKQFLHYNFDTLQGDRNQFFIGVFLVGVLTAQDYKNIVEILQNKNSDIKFNARKDTFTTSIDDSFMAKNVNLAYFEQTVKTIEYKLPGLLTKLFYKLKEYNRNEKENLNSEEVHAEYLKFIQKCCDMYDHRIFIKPNKIHEIALSYIREQGVEDLTMMFASNKYTKRATARLAYATIIANPQYYTSIIQNLYDDLACNKYLPKFLNISNYVDDDRQDFPLIDKLAGSNLLVKPDVLNVFFKQLHADILSLDDESVMKFNLTSIYIRVAISLLAGTRGSKNSASLEQISFGFKMMKLSEKSETKLSGLRVIPLCHTLISLLKSYQKICAIFNISSETFSLIVHDKVHKFSTDEDIIVDLVPAYVYDFLRNVPLNFGRHIFTKYAIQMNLNSTYLDAYLGHYSAGLEQNGIYSTLNYNEYINEVSEITEALASIYGVKLL